VEIPDLCGGGVARACAGLGGNHAERRGPADLVTLDPTGTASTNVYTHGFLVYDTLFAPDENLQIRKQMVGEEAVSHDNLSYTLILRPGLLFQDGSPVSTCDVIASLQRWMRLDIVGRTMAKDVQAMTAADAQTFIIVLKRSRDPGCCDEVGCAANRRGRLH
jgi:peptide/nickel transport system substrate-binding protein